MQKAILMLLLVVASGCATVGREISDAQMSTLKKGETTSLDAMRNLGQPTAITKLSDGRQVFTYSFAHAQARPASFIPFVGLFAGGTDVRSSAVVLTFDKTGVLHDYSSQQSATGSGIGFAAGAYATPDMTLPQEAR